MTKYIFISNFIAECFPLFIVQTTCLKDLCAFVLTKEHPNTAICTRMKQDRFLTTKSAPSQTVIMRILPTQLNGDSMKEIHYTKTISCNDFAASI